MSEMPTYEEMELITRSLEDATEHVYIEPPKDTQLIIDLKEIRSTLAVGWTQGTFRSMDGDYCLVGAVMYETVGTADPLVDDDDFTDSFFHDALMMIKGTIRYSARYVSNRRYRNVIRALKTQGGFMTIKGLIGYNDKHGRSKREILHFIDKTIESKS